MRLRTIDQMPEPNPSAAPRLDGAHGDTVSDAEFTRAESRAIMRATSDLVLVIDRDGRYLRVGPTGHDKLYRPAPELLGRRAHELLPARAADRILEVVRHAVDTGEATELEYPLDIGDDTVWFHATVAPTGEGTVVWIARDVTAQRAAEAARRESEAMFRLLAEHSSDLVCLHTPDGRYEYVSPSVARLLERTPEELIGTDPYAFVHPDDVARVRRESFDLALAGLQPPPMVYRIRTGGGEYVWFETLTQPIRDEGGNVVRLLTSSRDVTERRQSEQALEAAALRDELTGVHNRRGFLVEAERALAGAQRRGAGAILVYTDVDNLKPINDRHGHEAGDAALRFTADVLRATVREGDVLGRLGGDEFAMLLAPSSHTPPPGAAGGETADAPSVEQRIRERLTRRLAERERANATDGGDPWMLALSAGIVVLPEVPAAVAPAQTLRDLMREADRRLYEEKRARKTADVG
jgi:diguanylate cyclase (GGDEF)-like protein/PAS domain S-box-containing protein